MKHHLWYLTEEMIPLALFSEKVPATEKQALATKLPTVKPDEEMVTPSNLYGTGFQKPMFPENITEATTLADLAGKDSWFTMHTLQLDDSFLADSVDTWPQSPAFQTSAVNVRAINVVNDAAERGVKLSSDYLLAARSDEHYQNILQVVEQDRRMKPNLRKRKLQV